jgi:subtilase family serine protease
MERMLLVLKRSPEQETALRRLLDDQQDKASPNYHKWLTPTEFGRKFGPSDDDMQTITSWLQSHGFQVGSTKGRTALEFSGSASQVQEAFHTAIHKYLVKDKQHWANAGDPSIPAALTPAVAGVSSLHNFPRHPMSVLAGTFSREKATGKITAIQPQFTFPSGCVENSPNNNPCFYGLGPYDFATIYDLLPLWNSGINGTGQTIAIVGESDINIQDVRDFRNLFGLPVNDPTIILNGPDPGIQGDESEADIDVQWSGAVAPNATIDFVVSRSTETTAGIDLSAVYIVENNLAPVMSESYGLCELGLGTTGNQFFNSLWQQAAAQGITVFISAGDNGAAGCDDFNAASPAPAQFGLQVSGFASTPYNVAVGGTDFNDFSNPSIYWNTTNDSTTQASAKSYIPETTWNDSCTNAIFGTIGFSTNAETNCNNSRLIPSFVVPLGGSGGVSNCTTPSGSSASNCAGGYAKPSWQTGSGVPNDGKRDLPDVSLFASNGFLGNFYIVCESDRVGPCSLQYPYTNFLGFGGTSVSSPAFAGIMALVNQQMSAQGLSTRQGNANYIFYKLAAQEPAAFHDVTSGTIAMPCLRGSPNCTTTNSFDQYGVMTGYNAAPGYDLATGLGSVDAQTLVNKWSSVVSLSSATTLDSLTPTTITHGQAVNFSVTVKPQSGTGTPTGEISLIGGPTNSSQGIAGFNLSNGTVSGSTDLLPGGSYSVTAHYPGDSTYTPSNSSPIPVTVNKENSQPQTFLVTFDFNGNLVSLDTTTAVYGSPYLLRVNVANASGQVCVPVSSTAATGCPTGTVLLTNNGLPLDAGTYTLNNYGYLEDLTVQLPGGTDSVKAHYAGDNSFSANSATQAITITPASTTMGTPYVQYWSVGSAFVASVTTQAQSFGAAPTGTVSFFVNGNPVSGTISYSGTAGSPSNPTAALSATFTSSPSVLAAAGNYTISASYSGDTNYGSSTAPGYSIAVKYPAPLLSMTPPALTVAPGSSVTVSAIVDTSLKNVPVPTGTVPFINWGPMTAVTGTETYSTITDSNGNVALQASLTFTPAASESIGSNYAGDSNYPSAGGGGLVDITVTGTDFALVQGASPSLITHPGEAGGILLFVQGQSNYNLTLNFSSASCSGLPRESSCSFNPSSITGSGNTNVTFNTTAPHALATNLKPHSRSKLLLPALAVPFAGLLLIGISRRRSWRGTAMCLALGILFIGAGCGGSGGSSGGGGGGGSTDPGTPMGTYPVTITATAGSGSSAITHTISLTLIVQ